MKIIALLVPCPTPDPNKRKGCGARLQVGPGTDRAALRFARVLQKMDELAGEEARNAWELLKAIPVGPFTNTERLFS